MLKSPLTKRYCAPKNLSEYILLLLLYIKLEVWSRSHKLPTVLTEK